ncbi:hypothetical protein (mitochondrion) [Ogataea philodendri]|uniref:Homing endonuclease LAGLIDADG domain-containing protein n=1 Tax=Ogataea philodendri TaxID=1378263 RepID=S5TG16_9ASCO|nr:hypothetical protein [Ogataea philodendri]AGS44397.1 hypothetical protein [Ogataea philodendri]
MVFNFKYYFNNLKAMLYSIISDISELINYIIFLLYYNNNYSYININNHILLSKEFNNDDINDNTNNNEVSDNNHINDNNNNHITNNPSSIKENNISTKDKLISLIEKKHGEKWVKNYKNYTLKELKILLDKDINIFNKKYWDNVLKNKDIEYNEYYKYSILLGLALSGLKFKPNDKRYYYTHTLKDITYISGLRNVLIYFNLITGKLGKKQVYKNKNDKKYNNIVIHLRKLDNKYIVPLLSGLFRYNKWTNKWEMRLINKHLFGNYFTWISLGIWLYEKRIHSDKGGYIKLYDDSLKHINDIIFLHEYIKTKFNLDISLYVEEEKKNNVESHNNELNDNTRVSQYKMYIKKNSLDRIRLNLSEYFTTEFIDDIFENDRRSNK